MEIRALYASGTAMQKVIAERYGIHQSTVSDIIRGKRHKT